MNRVQRRKKVLNELERPVKMNPFLHAGLDKMREGLKLLHGAVSLDEQNGLLDTKKANRLRRAFQKRIDKVDEQIRIAKGE